MAVAYAENFLSFLFLNKGIAGHINAIYIFGSAVRGELEKESDIDVFIDTGNAEVEVLVNKSISVFMKSKDYDKWKLMNFTYPFSVQIGALEKWGLKSSIGAEGILLYSKTPATTLTNRNILFTVILPKKKSPYLQFIRSFFGRKEEGYNDTGIVGNLQGTRISATVFIIKKEHQQNIESALQKQKINYSFREIAFFD
jgi:hypothetical protein